MTEDSLQSRSLHLLSLSRTVRHYEAALSRAQGEEFNLFEILNIGHYEVYTHSPILAELLNPHGTHGHGAVFLRLFLELLEIRDFEAVGASVRTEVSAGALGRLDIVITDPSGKRILIENKIYAALQEKQLERYHRYDPEAHLVFLTLNGDAPADGMDSATVLKLKLLSYRGDIVRWLDCCRKEAATAAGVREAITQYLHLIRRLTQQNTSALMNHELVKAILQDQESYLAFSNLRDASQAVRRQIIVELNAKVCAGVPAALTLVEVLKGGGGPGERFLLASEPLTAHNLAAAFAFDKAGYQGCFFGFVLLDPTKESSALAKLQELFQTEFGVCRSSLVWPAWEWWSPRDWNDNTFAALHFGVLHQDIIKLIGRLKNVEDQLAK